MKFLMSLAILLVAQTGFAQLREKVGNTSYEAIKARMQKVGYTDMVEKLREGKDFKKIESSPELLRLTTTIFDLTLKDIPSVNDMNTKAALKRLINYNPIQGMADVGYFAAIIKDPAATKAQKEKAETNLRLLSAVALTLPDTAKPAEIPTLKLKAESAVNLANKVSNIESTQTVKDFVVKFESSLREGKSVEDAVKIASNGKFTEKDLKDCE